MNIWWNLWKRLSEFHHWAFLNLNRIKIINKNPKWISCKCANSIYFAKSSSNYHRGFSKVCLEVDERQRWICAVPTFKYIVTVAENLRLNSNFLHQNISLPVTRPFKKPCNERSLYFFPSLHTHTHTHTGLQHEFEPSLLILFSGEITTALTSLACKTGTL